MRIIINIVAIVGLILFLRAFYLYLSGSSISAVGGIFLALICIVALIVIGKVLKTITNSSSSPKDILSGQHEESGIFLQKNSDNNSVNMKKKFYNKKNMFCIKCGTELPEDANFCRKCGTSTSGNTESKANKTKWEYQMFTQILNTHKKKFQLEYPNAIWNKWKVPNEELAVLIDTAVRTLLQKAGEDGWEPAESTDAGILWENGRVETKDVTSFLETFAANQTRTVIPLMVKINFRRKT